MEQGFAAMESARERALYGHTLDMLEQCAPCRPLTVPPEEMNGIFKAVLKDHPELFWFEGQWQLTGGEHPQVQPEYTFRLQDIPVARAYLRQQVARFSGLTDAPPRERAAYVFRWLCSEVQYGTGASRGQTAYDALVLGSAVCKGLSKAYQLILHSLDMECVLVEGTLDGRARHVWNMVYLDGAWRHVDVSTGMPGFGEAYARVMGRPISPVFDAGAEDIADTHRIFREGEVQWQR